MENYEGKQKRVCLFSLKNDIVASMSCPYCAKSLPHAPIVCSLFSARVASFSENYRFLSNFWPAKVVFDGVEYPSVENAYQAANTLNLEDRVFFQTATPGQAKRKSHKLVVRTDWVDVKLSIMEDLVEQKFSDALLLEKLKSTGNRQLVEGNTWHDNFWGECSCRKRLECDRKGLNHLGKLLMKIRERNTQP
jgi:ribA/ribD-fused uncharacterized protein